MILAYLGCLSVVGLSLAETSGAAPVSGVPLGGGSDLGARAGPEPSVHVGRLQVRAVTTVEVTFSP